MSDDLVARISAAEEAAADARRRGDLATATEADARAARLWRERRQQLASTRERGSRDWQRTVRWKGEA